MPRINDANFEQYLKEIRETPLLTAQQELELSRRIRGGASIEWNLPCRHIVAERFHAVDPCNKAVVSLVPQQQVRHGIDVGDNKRLAEVNAAVGVARHVAEIRPGIRSVGESRFAKDERRAFYYTSCRSRAREQPEAALSAGRFAA